MDGRDRPAERHDSGFSLIEVVVATAVLLTGVLGLAQLAMRATQANADARLTTFATLLARQKVEELFAMPSSDDGLPLSPPGALLSDAAGFVDYLDASGSVLSGGSGPPPDARFVRRWSVEALPADPDHAVVVQVVVEARGGGRALARLVSVRVSS